MNIRANFSQQLFDYISYNDHYEIVTRNGMTIEVADDYSLQAMYKPIESEETTLIIFFYSEKKKFVEILNIKKIEDIYALTGDHLLEVYQKGFAEMICFVGLRYSYSLIFQKSGKDIVATNDWQVTHVIAESEKPETLDQYVAYTRRYYQMLENNEN